MDTYHPAKTFSSIDHHGRYAFGNQGPIGQWNLTRFAETLLPLLHADQKTAIAMAESTLDAFTDLHQASLQSCLTAKIGLKGGNADDWTLVESLLQTMADGEADFTLVFRHLATALDTDNDEELTRLFNHPAKLVAWLKAWRTRLQRVDRHQTLDLMRRTNPIYIPRNHRIEEAINAGNEGDFEPFHRINQVLQHPFTERAEFSEYEAAPAPDEVVHATFCGT